MSFFNSTRGEANPVVGTTSIATGLAYDDRGAAIYIAVILMWYSTGLAMMLFLQARPRTLPRQFLFDSSGSTSKRLPSFARHPFGVYGHIQADDSTKQILTELKDPERRQRLWKSYYGSSEKHNEHYLKFYQTLSLDNATINRIERKLADIDRLSSVNNDNDDDGGGGDVPPVPLASTRFFGKRFARLRRSPMQALSSAVRNGPKDER